jgi:transposase-like protein
MFKVQPQVMDNIPVVEIKCPICGDDSGVEPISNIKDQWQCCDCGMEFEVINND